MAKWIHKGCGGEVEERTEEYGFGVKVIARCKKCGKEFIMGSGFLFLGVPILIPSLDGIDELEPVREKDEGIELSIHAYSDPIDGCTWDGDLIVDGKEYDIGVLYDLLQDEVIANRIRELLKERDAQ